MPGERESRAGDTVLHRPSGETWYVLGVSRERDKIAPAGWPVCTARLSDCELIERGSGITAEEREGLERTWGGGWDA